MNEVRNMRNTTICYIENVAEDSHLYRWGMNAASTEFTQVIEGGQLEIFEL